MQSDAGGLLGEVKRKISDMQYYMKLVSALKELRSHRREAYKKTGELTMYMYIYMQHSHSFHACNVQLQSCNLHTL